MKAAQKYRGSLKKKAVPAHQTEYVVAQVSAAVSVPQMYLTFYCFLNLEAKHQAQHSNLH
jgi:hypothetical protein